MRIVVFCLLLLSFRSEMKPVEKCLGWFNTNLTPRFPDLKGKRGKSLVVVFSGLKEITYPLIFIRDVAKTDVNNLTEYRVVVKH